MRIIEKEIEKVKVERLREQGTEEDVTKTVIGEREEGKRGCQTDAEAWNGLSKLGLMLSYYRVPSASADKELCLTRKTLA